MSFTHVQGASGTSGGTITQNVVLTTNPVMGNLVCVAFTHSTGLSTLITVKDANNNSYTKTPQSPAIQGTFYTYIYYLAIAPANANKTITISWTVANNIYAWAEEFGVSGGSAIFDTDAAGASPSAASISTPTITPSGTGELLWALGFPSGTTTAPTSGGTLGVWTGSAGAVLSGTIAEYDLSASSATAVNYTLSSGGQAYSSMAVAFSIGAVNLAPYIITPIADYQWLGGDSD